MAGVSKNDQGSVFPDVMNTQDLANMLGYSRAYIQSKTRSGDIPAHRIPGTAKYIYLRDEILDWLRSNSI